LLNLSPSHFVGKLTLIVLQNLFTILSRFFVCSHHTIQNHLSSEAAYKQLEGSVLIIFKFKVTTSQIFEELIDRTRFTLLSWLLFLGYRPSLNNRQELAELDLFGAILIN
jgi:hypothetical protein